MKRRLDLAMTLVGDPRIIFLDEPTTGLDPRSRRTMWQIIRDLVADGVTDLPHHPVPGGGRRARRPHRRPQPRQARRRRHRRRAQAAHPRRPHPSCASPTRACSTRPATAVGAGSPRRRGADPADPQRRQRQRDLRALLDRLDEHSIEADELTVHTPDLDDVFLALTGQPSSHRAQGGRPMSTLALAVRDSSTMLRRNLLHAPPLPVPHPEPAVSRPSCCCCCSSTSSATP